jgi:hypothetical protein
VGCLVAGMTGGADSVDDLDLLRHGAMPALFGGVRAPSTLGSFLRSFTWCRRTDLRAGLRTGNRAEFPACRLVTQDYSWEPVP